MDCEWDSGKRVVKINKCHRRPLFHFVFRVAWLFVGRDDDDDGDAGVRKVTIQYFR